MAADEVRFAADLYRGAAAAYDRYRLPYPAAMIADLVRRAGVSGHGRLLDLACGTGQLAFPLRRWFTEVWAVDQEPDMIRVVRAKAAAEQARDLRPVLSAAETLGAPPGYFELAVVGNAFHRLNRDLAASRILGWLQPGGHLALCWSSQPWNGEQRWQQALDAVLDRWKTALGAGGRIPAGWAEARSRRPDSAVLCDAGFELAGSFEFATGHRWTVPDLAGLIRSTSFLPAAVLGDQAAAFDADLAASLGSASEDGVLTETVTFQCELARKPDLGFTACRGRTTVEHMPTDADRAGTPAGVFGAELRYYRSRAGLSQKDVAALAHVSHDVISKIETGERPPAEDFPPRLDAIPELDTRDALARLWESLKKGQKQRLYGWFQAWADIEAQATVLRWYEPLVVPGLLQTEDYARAILSARPDGNLADLEEQVAARIARQNILERTGGPQLWCILDEGVLHRAIGGPKVMRDQLYHLAEVAEHPRTSIQVIRYGGAHAGLLAHFVIADLEGKPPEVYLETAAEGIVTDSSSAVNHVAMRFDRLRAQAESWVASRDLIRKVAEELWT